MLAPPTLQKIHPLGKSPVIVDDGKVYAESGAILEYLVEKTGKLGAGDGQEKIDYRYFMHYAEGSLMPILLVKLIFWKVSTAKVPFFIKPIVKKIAGQVGGTFVTPNLQRHSAFLEQHLAKHAWFAGKELTAADVQMSYPLEAIYERSPEFATPSIKKWVEKIRARPAFVKAIERGGPQQF